MVKLFSFECLINCIQGYSYNDYVSVYMCCGIFVFMFSSNVRELYLTATFFSSLTNQQKRYIYIYNKSVEILHLAYYMTVV